MEKQAKKVVVCRTCGYPTVKVFEADGQFWSKLNREFVAWECQRKGCGAIFWQARASQQQSLK